MYYMQRCGSGTYWCSAFLYYFLHFPDSSFKEWPIRRVDFRPIELRRPLSENLFSILNRTVKAAMLFSDIDSEPYWSGRRYLVALNDYRRWSTALSS
ncbi:hypothetical protein EVAR_9414_1 [Eumeta japonica]|uniref:Uncharacterized protein n=1 Tax=Eumeta variegata TaxID=151549 RepID=A0A4C1UED7_EUMVA|nr:hypothetical protein EVAR_9414_1 [Eumeta japonica]